MPAPSINDETSYHQNAASKRIAARAPKFASNSQPNAGCVFMSPSLRLMGALNRSDLQCEVRHLTVRFHHSHGAKGERTAKNENRKIPGHRYSLPLPTPHSTNRAGMGVTTVTKHRFYLATPKRELPSKVMRFGS